MPVSATIRFKKGMQITTEQALALVHSDDATLISSRQLLRDKMAEINAAKWLVGEAVGLIKAGKPFDQTAFRLGKYQGQWRLTFTTIGR